MNDAKKPCEFISVVIIDDHFVVRQGVRALLETQADIRVLGEAADGVAGVELVAQLRPDVVLMDIMMPILDGVAATQQIRALMPQTQVIILTSFLESEHVLPAIQSGALSYLLKDVASEELIEAVRKAVRGEAVLHPQVTARMVQALQKSEAPLAHFGTLLSEREREVLQLIAEGLANHDIATRLFISEKTVKTHVSNILSKLQVSDRTQAAVYAWRHHLVRSTS